MFDLEGVVWVLLDGRNEWMALPLDFFGLRFARLLFHFAHYGL